MKIEVTKQTFEKLFSENEFLSIDKKETYLKRHFYNDKLQQRGVHIFNYVSSKEGNFYLIDINA